MSEAIQVELGCLLLLLAHGRLPGLEPASLGGIHLQHVLKLPCELIQLLVVTALLRASGPT